MKSVRLLPVLVLAISSLLVLKTVGLVFNGSYVLGSAPALAAGAGASGGHDASAAAAGDLLGGEPTMTDADPTMDDPSPVPAPSGAGGHGASAAAHGAEAGHETAAAAAPGSCAETGAATGEAHGASNALAASMIGSDCEIAADAAPVQLDAQGNKVPLNGADGASASQAALLEGLSGRRGELDAYAQELAMRQALVDAAEKRLEERQGTLAAMEAQISALVDQREKLETGQFAGIVEMYEAMKPKDAANIFNTLDMEVLLRVAKIMSPRKMAPILAAMEPARAQDLTVRMADLADQPAGQMTPSDLSQLPQIVGQ